MHFTLVHGIGRLVHTVAGKIELCTKTFVPGICRLVVGFCWVRTVFLSGLDPLHVEFLVGSPHILGSSSPPETGTAPGTCSSAVTLVRARHRAYVAQNKCDLFCLELTDLEKSRSMTAHATKL